MVGYQTKTCKYVEDISIVFTLCIHRIHILNFHWPELKTLELDILNPESLIGISSVETFNFLFNPLLLDITFPTTCNKDTFDYKYKDDAILI